MKKHLFLLFVILSWQTLFAQDKIITTSGDTILCRIVSISNDHVVYDQQIDSLIAGKVIPISNISEYFRTPTQQQSNERYIPQQFSPWLLNLSIGGAYLPWLLDGVEEGYTGNDDYKKLNKGFSVNANVHHLITNHVGFGVQYSFFTSGYKSHDPVIIGGAYNIPLYSNMDMRERQYVHYAGLSAIFRQFIGNNRKFSLNETLSGGLLLYHAEEQSTIFTPSIYSYDNFNVFGNRSQNMLVTGNTFGAMVGLSAEYKILPYLSIGIGGNFMYGKLTRGNAEYKDSSGESQKITDEKLANPIKLSRIDYSLSIRFQL